VLDHNRSDVLLAFTQFRRSVIGFLKLPLGVSESALRDALNAISPNLLASYKHRAAQATLAWASMCRADMESLRLHGPADKNAATPFRPPHASEPGESGAAAS
jgi:hypothetical protein